jgi:hypothetical protein
MRLAGIENAWVLERECPPGGFEEQACGRFFSRHLIGFQSCGMIEISISKIWRGIR